MKIIDEYIEKRLDRYYAKKCAEQIYHALKFYDMTIKYTKHKNCYIIQIKKRKEDTKYYKEFHRIYFNEGLEAYLKIYNADKSIIAKDACKLLES